MVDTKILPYYCFHSTDIRRQYEARFWNCQGKHIAIVPSVTEGIDWAAYIGTDASDSYDEDSTLNYVADWGCKLSEKDARHFFPEIKMPYRD